MTTTLAQTIERAASHKWPKKFAAWDVVDHVRALGDSAATWGTVGQLIQAITPEQGFISAATGSATKVLMPIAVHPECAVGPALLIELVELALDGHDQWLLAGCDRRHNAALLRNDKDFRHQNACYQSLVRHVDDLTALLAHPKPRHRLVATFALSFLGEAAKKSVQPVSTLAEQEGDPGVRASAILCLGYVAGYLKQSSPYDELFAKAMGDSDRNVRIAAAWNLAEPTFGKQEAAFDVLFEEYASGSTDTLLPALVGYPWNVAVAILDERLWGYLPDKQDALVGTMLDRVEAGASFIAPVVQRVAPLLFPDGVALDVEPRPFQSRLVAALLASDAATLHFLQEMGLPARPELARWIGDETLLPPVERSVTVADTTKPFFEWALDPSDEVQRALMNFGSASDAVAAAVAAVQHVSAHRDKSPTKDTPVVKLERQFRALLEVRGSAALEAIVAQADAMAKARNAKYVLDWVLLALSELVAAGTAEPPPELHRAMVSHFYDTSATHANQIKMGRAFPESVREELVLGVHQFGGGGRAPLYLLELAATPKVIASALSRLDKNLSTEWFTKRTYKSKPTNKERQLVKEEYAKMWSRGTELIVDELLARAQKPLKHGKNEDRDFFVMMLAHAGPAAKDALATLAKADPDAGIRKLAQAAIKVSDLRD